MMQVMELEKSKFRDEVMLISQEINPVAIAIIKLSIYQSVSQSVENSVK